jgi:L-2-hydroxyglutarate oxidase LhgO
LYIFGQHKITESEAMEIEPRVQTFQSALWSPTTKSADVQQVATALLSEVTQSGTIVLNDAPFVSATALPSSAGWNIRAGSHRFQCSHVINCAGLYADRVAQSFGFARDYTMLPFKGIYLYCNPQTVQLRTHIYPVPNLATPFLGVHTTLSVDGTSKIGPTAIPGLHL